MNSAMTGHHPSLISEHQRDGRYFIPTITNPSQDVSFGSTVPHHHTYQQYLGPSSDLRERPSWAGTGQPMPGSIPTDLNFSYPTYGPPRPEANPSIYGVHPSATPSLDPWKIRDAFNDLNIQLMKLQQTCHEIKNEMEHLGKQ